MKHQSRRVWLATLLILAGAACAPVDDALPDQTPFSGATGPQYEPGDPCRGVVPELCAFDSSSPEVN